MWSRRRFLESVAGWPLDGEPSIGTRAENRGIVVGVWMMRAGEEKVVARRIRQVLEKR
jgi:hypothetical protein